MLKYIIEFLFCSGLFMALYKLLIERRVSHSWARRYLITTMLLSIIIPTLELPLYPGETVVYEIPVFTPPAEPKSDIPAYLDDTAFPDMESQQDEWVTDTEQTTTYEEATSSTIDWACHMGDILHNRGFEFSPICVATNPNSKATTTLSTNSI